MSGKCYRCGTIYDGWSCPMCSLKRDMEKEHEEARRTQEMMHEREIEAIEDARFDTRMDIQAAADQQQEAIAQSWRLQAEAKTNRAYEMYRAGLAEDAVKLCMDAIAQDPGNIRAYRVAAWAYSKTGQSAMARDMVEKQIKLLRTDEYKNSSDEALAVLRDVLRIHDNRALVSAFVEVSECFGSDQTPSGWFFLMGYSSFNLIDELVKHSFYEEARRLFANTVRDVTLLACTYEIDLDIRSAGKADRSSLVEYLRGVASTSRQAIIEDFKDIAASGKFSESAVNCVRNQILDRYEEWKPHIETESAKAAAHKARHKADNSNWPYVGWMAGIAFAIVTPIIGGRVLHGVLGFPAGLVWLIGIGGGILGGLLLSRAIRGSISNNARPGFLASLRREEEELRESVQAARIASTQDVPGTETIEARQNPIASGTSEVEGRARVAEQDQGCVVVRFMPSPDRKYATIDAIQTMIGMSLTHTKDLVEAAPHAAIRGLSEAQANALRQRLEQLGAKVKIGKEVGFPDGSIQVLSDEERRARGLSF